MSYGSADVAGEKAFQSRAGFKSGSTWNKPGSSRPTGTLPRPAPITGARDSYVTRPGNFAPAPQAKPANVFSNLISRASSLVQAPKVGPRGTTIADVARVAAGDITGPRPITVPQTPQVNVRNVYDSLIGAPLATAGEKYGGFPTAAQADAFVRGEAYNALLAGQMARDEADRLREEAAIQYETDINPMVGGSLAAEQLARNKRILATPLSDLALQMSGGRRNVSGQIPWEDLYGANMARINAARGAGDFTKARMDQLRTVQAAIENGAESPPYWNQGMSDMAAALRYTPGESQAELNARAMSVPLGLQQMNRNLVESGATTIGELANLISGLTPSELMQQVAVERLGYDPSLAAGLYPATENLDYQNMLIAERNAEAMSQGRDPTANVAELILAQYGLEGLDQYQAQQARNAMYGTPSQQLAAEQNQQDAANALFDEEVRTEYGFDPARVTNTDPDFVRQLVMNPVFTEIFDAARQNIRNGEDPFVISADAAKDYLRRSGGDDLGAQVIGRILASFDLNAFG